VGALAAVLAGATVGSAPRPAHYRWWIWAPGGGYATAHLTYYLGLGALTAAWWRVGRIARARELSARALWALLGAWATPLALGVPLASRDVYSYVAEGRLAQLGFNPYHVGPNALSSGPLVDSIAWVWRATPSPYGPLFVDETHLAAAISGRSLIAQVLVERVFALGALAALCAAIAPLARGFGADEGLARWLVVLSPLALLSAASAAHNDTTMLALLALGLVAWRRGGRPLAVGLIALAACVKLPALLALPFLYAPAWRAGGARRRALILLEGGGVAAAVLALVTLASGHGWAWLSPSALKIPTELRVAITPVVAAATLIASALHTLGASVSTHGVVTVVQDVAGALALALVGVLLWGTTEANRLVRLGLAFAAVVALSPTLWPWYWLWPLSVLALTRAQRSWALAVVAGGAMLLVGPGGTPMLGGVGADLAGAAALATGLYLATGARPARALAEVDRVG
jgi:hypothetical protein